VPHVVFGLLVIALGLILLAHRQAGIGINPVHLWPIFLVLLGAARFATADTHRKRCLARRRSGVWLMLLGGWGLVDEYHVAGFTYETSWPLLIVAAGLLLVWRAFEPVLDGEGSGRGDH
jgi:hypothetical protein